MELLKLLPGPMLKLHWKKKQWLQSGAWETWKVLGTLCAETISSTCLKSIQRCSISLCIICHFQIRGRQIWHKQIKLLYRTWLLLKVNKHYKIIIWPNRERQAQISERFSNTNAFPDKFCISFASFLSLSDSSFSKCCNL